MLNNYITNVNGDTYFEVYEDYHSAWVYVCNSYDESAVTIAENLEGDHFRGRVYIYDEPEIVTAIYETMVNNDIEPVDVSELTKGHPIDFSALEPYEDDISINPDNGHVIALTSFINHFYE